jgi:CheY-like chemotaxis protein
VFQKTPRLAMLNPSSLVAGFKAMRQSNDSRVILVVDDQAGNREVLRVFLIWSGYNVVEAGNGLDAVNIAAKDCPDLIFMDLAMPVMDGFKAVRRLREFPQTRDVPIVAYTAYDTAGHREQALRTGFNEFLTKPIDFKKVESILDRFLNGRH